MKRKEAFEILNKQLKEIPRSQIRLMSLAVLPRLMDALDNQTLSCPKCQKFTHEGEAFVNDIKPLFAQEIRVQRAFENWVEASQKHLKIEHHMQVKGRLASSWAAIGMLGGILIALGLVFFYSAEQYIGGISLGLITGMLIGYISGKMKENKLAKENKLY